MANNGGEPPSKAKKASDFFPNKAHVTDALRAILARLDASDPTLVYEKHMPPSDRSKDQNRLLMSCKCESKRAAFASMFTETEMPLVHQPLKTEEDEEHDSNDHGGKGKGKRKRKTKGGGEDGMGGRKNKCGGGGKADDYYEDDDDDEWSVVGKEDGDGQGNKQRSTVQGVDVQAYDCDGRVYKLNIKYLSCNDGYRITGHDYTVFLRNNGLLVGGGGGGVTRKRSGRRRRQKKRRRRSLPDEDEPNDEQPAVRDAAGDIQMELWAFRSPKLSIGEKGQPDGALGLLLLHHRGGEAGQGQARVGGAAAATEEVRVAAPQEVVVVEPPQPRQNSHGGMAMATRGEDMVAAGDCAGDAATVAVEDAAGNKPGDAAPRSTRDMTLGPLERLIAVWLWFHSSDADHSHTDVNDNGEADAKTTSKGVQARLTKDTFFLEHGLEK